MADTSPCLLWLRRDLRLCDNAALLAACARGGPVIPVFIHDDAVAALGAAPKWRLGLAIESFARRLEAAGSRLVLRRGDALKELRALARETGARAVFWSRLYDPGSVARDSHVKAALKADGIAVESHAGHVLFEPWTVTTRTGGFYRVYSPMWRALKDRNVPMPAPAPARLPVPAAWPGERLQDWRMAAGMNRGADICLPHQQVGEAAALARLDRFMAQEVETYRETRDLPGRDATSHLSENLTYGEISPRQCWHAGLGALHRGARGAEPWLRQLAWREFAWHLAWHSPHILSHSWREGWAGFPWRHDGDSADARAWKQGRTGVPFVDAAMRQMYVTGRMHNRARMIVASFLTKHLMIHWRVGMGWFAECLTDWDVASNAMGWQWVAGSGPDAAPYFRIFNPETQARKFDPDGSYRRRWIAEGQARPGPLARAFFDAVPRSWGLDANDAYPPPVIGLAEGRARALAAYAARHDTASG